MSNADPTSKASMGLEMRCYTRITTSRRETAPNACKDDPKDLARKFASRRVPWRVPGAHDSGRSVRIRRRGTVPGTPLPQTYYDYYGNKHAFNR